MQADICFEKKSGWDVPIILDRNITVVGDTSVALVSTCTESFKFNVKREKIVGCWGRVGSEAFKNSAKKYIYIGEGGDCLGAWNNSSGCCMRMGEVHYSGVSPLGWGWCLTHTKKNFSMVVMAAAWKGGSHRVPWRVFSLLIMRKR